MSLKFSPYLTREPSGLLLKVAVLGTAFLMGGTSGFAQLRPETTPSSDTAAPSRASSKVVLVERPQVVDQFSVDGNAVKQMFTEGLLTLTGQKSSAAAWIKLGIKPQDIVGIKISTVGGPLLSSHKALVETIIRGLESAQVPAANIILFDKFEEDMSTAGYTPNTDGPRGAQIRCIVPGTGFDPALFYLNENLGRLIWGDMEFVGQRPTKDDLIKAAERAVQRKEDPTATQDKSGIDEQTSNRSYFAKLVSKTCTKIINVPVLSDSTASGLSGCMSSLALGVVDNSRRYQGEDTFGDPAILEILDRDLFRKKVVLHVLDALVANYAGGPRFNPQFCVSAGALYLSRDPVAIDTLALKRIEDWRQTGHVPLLKKQASHVKSAPTFNLGEGDVKKIELVTLP